MIALYTNTLYTIIQKLTLKSWSLVLWSRDLKSLWSEVSHKDFQLAICIFLLLLLLCIYLSYKKLKNSDLRGKEVLKSEFHLYLLLFGTFVLAYMMASHNIDQHSYLASVYFFLHFQYNGWFLFGIIGAALYFLKQNFHVSIDDGLPFRFLKWSVLPAYGLSVLWMDLPWFVYILVVAFVILQTVGIAILLLRIYSVKDKVVPHILPLIKWGSLFAGSAYGIKFLLQLFSVIPAMSKLAFGFRPIVIAYLHLVLLAASSTTLILLLTGLGVLKYNRNFARGFYVLLIGIFCNEAILALQGFASFEYIAIPWANMALFTVSIVMLTGLIVMFSSQWSKQIAAAANGFGHSGR